VSIQSSVHGVREVRITKRVFCFDKTAGLLKEKNGRSVGRAVAAKREGARAENIKKKKNRSIVVYVNRLGSPERVELGRICRRARQTRRRGERRTSFVNNVRFGRADRRPLRAVNRKLKTRPPPSLGPD